jgi:uncharacterized Zn-binding protein involved in type VI secretion
MPAVQRQGDFNSKGGIVTSGISSVRVNGRPIAVPSRQVTPHPPCSKKRPLHCIARTSGGAMRVRVEGQPVLLTGNKDTCGCGRAGGSTDVRAV